jgi:hypothetical protein
MTFLFHGFITFIFISKGLCSDLKTVPQEMIRARALRTGDGSSKYAKLQDAELLDNNNHTQERDTEHFWGWGDNAMTDDDLKNVEILNRVLD